MELRYSSGNIKNQNVHKIGVIALGSHLENHGPSLPIDTDAKIASYIALNASLQSGTKFLGVIYPAYEIDEIDHGMHDSLSDLVNSIIETLNSGKRFLKIDKVVIVNAHGGNLPLYTCLDKIEYETGLIIQLNNKVIETEGPHGGSGELSMGKVLGILDESEVENQTNLKIYGEVGLSKFSDARAKDPNIEKGAIEIEEEGVYVDLDYGKQLFSLAINSVLLDIEKFLDF